MKKIILVVLGLFGFILYKRYTNFKKAERALDAAIARMKGILEDEAIERHDDWMQLEVRHLDAEHEWEMNGCRHDD
ncbi:MAG: hypothetical protein A2252_09095 [Elusimicrobia bacterium RIFOXYA2_FULL_39_19]|nr:MAG: hypothetical protein A2252_09095 [Elusimicrobia bacterium RIFOXYA2_FULL_39_19]